ncbi:hypothetical protein [Novosphingobium sp. PASSN1]|uniref:hypothetical protein n=1 Tax=Novosphingobium sp. PASSN1 TaxID=2015561 RepID=UPI0025DA9FAE|nr:hypothetical protein [Novosphingobium sp. PASSN1]
MNRVMPTAKLAIMLAPLLLIGGCGTSTGPQAGSTASGEVLPGSVSDAMLDTNGSQAQAPLAPAAHKASDKSNADAGAESSDAAVDAASPAEPAAADQAPPRPNPTASAKPATP